MDETILDDKFRYRNKEWLDHQINVLGKSQSQVAIECGVVHSVISYWMGAKKTKKEYSIKNKISIKESKRKRYLLNKESVIAGSKEWYRNNKDYRINYLKEYRMKNDNIIKEKRAEKRKRTKIQAMEILGGCKCVICGDKNLSHLTLDHINNDGNLYRYERRFKNISGDKIYNHIVNGSVSEVELKDLRVLCYNHNCAQRREYLDLPRESQTKIQRKRTELWREVFTFFGPCHCGESELKFLTISHIHNNGAERRRNGEGTGVELIRYFQKLGWTQSLKEDFCLECWNCNCSRGKIGE